MSELREGHIMNNPDLSNSKKVVERATTMERNDNLQQTSNQKLYRRIMDTVIRDCAKPLQRLKDK